MGDLERGIRIWQRTRDPVVSAWICRHVSRPVALHGDAQDAWMAQARAPDATALGGLLGTLTACRQAELDQRIVQMASWPPDPRIAVTLISEMRYPTYRADRRASRQRVRRMARLVVASADPSHLAALRDVVTRARFVYSGPMGRFVALQGQQAIAELLPATLLDEADAAWIAARLADPPPEGQPDALRALCWSEPDNLDARRVLADRLLEAGDPWGTFLRLQLALWDAPRGAGARGRRAEARALARAYAGHFLGPLAPVCPSRRARFEAGFPVAVHVRCRRPEDVDAVAGLPAWSHIRTLTVARKGLARDELVQRLLDAAPWPRLRALRHVPVTKTWTLQGKTGFPGVTDLGIDAPWNVALPRLDTFGALRHLRLHRAYGDDAMVARCIDAGYGELDSLILDRSGPALFEALAPTRLRRVGFVDQGVLATSERAVGEPFRVVDLVREDKPRRRSSWDYSGYEVRGTQAVVRDLFGSG